MKLDELKTKIATREATVKFLTARAPAGSARRATPGRVLFDDRPDPYGNRASFAEAETADPEMIDWFGEADAAFRAMQNDALGG